MIIPAATLGVLAPVPIIHAAAKLRDRFLWTCAAGYLAAVVVVYVLILSVSSASPYYDAASGLFVLGMLALAIGCTVHAFRLRRRVFTPRAKTPRAPITHAQDQPAYAVALAARRQREEARALAERDPVMARDLRIGRPDLPRQFDDGGLVDVNHVPAQALVAHLGLDTADAAKVVAAREQIDGFTAPEELTAYAGLPPATVDWVRDRLVFLRF